MDATVNVLRGVNDMAITEENLFDFFERKIEKQRLVFYKFQKENIETFVIILSPHTRKVDDEFKCEKDLFSYLFKEDL